jgi:dethiobiotin synthetase
LRRFFVTSTGTDIGKTYITAALTFAARSAGLTARAIKPVVSGFSNLAGSDSAELLAAQGLGENQLETVTPWRFTAALAPNAAARREGRSIDFGAIVDFCHRALNGPEDLVLIEGAGGVMAPLTDDETMLDWMRALGCPALVVGGSYLGAVSHMLTAVAVLRQSGIPIGGVILSESDASIPPGPGLDETAAVVARFTGCEVTPVCRRPANDWRSVPELNAFLG